MKTQQDSPASKLSDTEYACYCRLVRNGWLVEWFDGCSTLRVQRDGTTKHFDGNSLGWALIEASYTLT